MARLVLKFGGTSVKDCQNIKNVARIVVQEAQAGNEVAVVVSAMGQTTDQLIELAGGLSENPDKREMDMLLATGEQVSIALLSMAIQEQGKRARSFTGPQAGILTDETHGFARIKTVHSSRLESTIRRGEIPVIAGFQGMTRSSEITTLGRGGSDTTAVAIAAAIGAQYCDIYTDVDGVYTTNPRQYSGARRIRVISYEDMLALASSGAQVLNARSVELAMKTKVPIRLRPTFAPEDAGTLVTHKDFAPDYPICGIACDTNRVSFDLSLPPELKTMMRGRRVVSEFSDETVSTSSAKAMRTFLRRLEDIGVQAGSVVWLPNLHEGEPTPTIAISAEKRLSREISSLLEDLKLELGGEKLNIDSAVAQISIVGKSIPNRENLQAEFMQALTDASIPVKMMTQGNLTVSAIVPERFGDDAVKRMHERFCSSVSLSGQ